MKNLFMALSLTLISLSIAYAQRQDSSWSIRNIVIEGHDDSLNHLLHKFGTFKGHFRTYFMSTINHKENPDYYALGIGGGLGYYSPIFKNFQVGISGSIVYNIASSQLGTTNNYSNRYEISLFDVTNPDNHKDLDRLEDLYIRYYFLKDNKAHLQFGKFHLKTPLVNLQGGRMRPNLQEGLWMELDNWSKIKFKSGWLWKSSPRGTIHSYNMGNSIGVYPNGRATNGEKAIYKDKVKTDGLAIFNIATTPIRNLKLEVWNYRVIQLQNTLLSKIEWKIVKNDIEWTTALQYTWQHSLYNDTLSIEKQYVSKDEQSHSFSGRINRKNKLHDDEWNLSYTRITKHGRFLFPREWGVEAFYTFMQRERIEGAGNTDAILLQYQNFVDEHKHFSFQTSVGMFWMPKVNNALLNKYALPSFYQTNIRARYQFAGLFKGLQAEVLLMYKGNMKKNLPEISQYYHNKVDVYHLSIVLDYYF